MSTPSKITWNWIGWAQFKARAKLRFDPDPVDAASFGDEVAASIDWNPVQPNTLSFWHRFSVITGERAVYKVPLLLLVPLVLSLVALSSLLLIAVFVLLSGLLGGTGALFVSGPIALLVLGVVGAVCWSKARPIQLDRSINALWTGRYSSKSDSHVRLTDIHAVQLLGFTLRYPRRAGAALQINLVLRGGRRIELLTLNNHPFGGYRDALFADAESLAGFLGVPLWNGVHALDRPKPGQTLLKDLLVSLGLAVLAAVCVYAYYHRITGQ
ncbi:MAG: hypothetical protein AAGA11_18365 [Pseudomonadota bacterium]